jgi:hypothetical protein
MGRDVESIRGGVGLVLGRMRDPRQAERHQGLGTESVHKLDFCWFRTF